ncbi:MAG: hypothetical protein IID37_01860, partial [Planctomycetes bacterium]|nr:hypothetical protein [Planctomycetota bacterium]
INQHAYTRTPDCDCKQDDWSCEHLEAYDRTHRAEHTIWDIVGKLIKYGSISDKQTAFLRSLLDQIAKRPELEAKRKAQHDAAAPCPSGRVRITGVILSTREVESDYGYSRYSGPVTYTKMLVLDDSGNLFVATDGINEY